MNIANLPASDFAELLTGPMIDIYIGPEPSPHHYAIHSNLFNRHSTFFSQTPINGEPRRNIDNKVLLPDEDPDAFCLLIKWLYQGTITNVSTLPKDQKWNYAHTCQKLYFLCERIGHDHHGGSSAILELKNLAMDNFRRGCHESGLVPGPEEMKPVYERTPRGSPLRKLISRIAARQIMDPETKRDAEIYRECFASSPEFAVDVLNAIRDGSEGWLMDDPNEGNGSCRWHEHDFEQKGNGSCAGRKKSVSFEAGVKESLS